MHSRSLSAVAIAALGLAVCGVAAAQTTTTPSTTSATTTDTWRMPYQRGFWGHAGASIGQSTMDDGCIAGTPCDDKDQAFRVYAGGRFNNAIGLELGVMNPGQFDRGGGETDGWGADVALVAGFPIGANSAIFGKAGFIYSRMEVSGTAPGLQTGKERGFGPRFGIGGQIGFTPQWALRADYDRFRIPLPGGKEDVDALMLGVQYTFR